MTKITTSGGEIRIMRIRYMVLSLLIINVDVLVLPFLIFLSRRNRKCFTTKTGTTLLLHSHFEIIILEAGGFNRLKNVKY